MVKGKGENMKGTLQHITGQDTGIVVFGFGPPKADNWGKQKDLYSFNRSNITQVDNCLAWVKTNGLGATLPNVVLQRLQTPGVLYSFDLFLILAPQGWN
jgi:hypothetical protein